MISAGLWTRSASLSHIDNSAKNDSTNGGYSYLDDFEMSSIYIPANVTSLYRTCYASNMPGLKLWSTAYVCIAPVVDDTCYMTVNLNCHRTLNEIQ
jgi:hypothetical protein